MLNQFQAVHSHLDVMIIETQVGLAMLGDPCIINKITCFACKLYFNMNLVWLEHKQKKEILTFLALKGIHTFGTSLMQLQEFSDVELS